MSLFLYAITPSYSAAGLVAYALDHHCDNTIAWFKDKGTEGFEGYYDKAVIGCPEELTSDVLEADQWIFCGSKAYVYFFSKYKKALKESRGRKVKVILTDSHFCRDYIKLGNIFAKREVIVFAMPDIFPYCVGLNPIPYYPPADVSLDNIEENKKDGIVVICHSPFRKVVSNAKGTAEIKEIIGELRKIFSFVRGRILTDCERKETLRIKAQSHIFIDQLVDGNPNIPMLWGAKKYNGALGKSGCEAMFLNSFVLTGAPEPCLNGEFFPTPPICWVNYVNCKDNLLG